MPAFETAAQKERRLQQRKEAKLAAKKAAEDKAVADAVLRAGLGATPNDRRHYCVTAPLSHNP